MADETRAAAPASSDAPRETHAPRPSEDSPSGGPRRERPRYGGGGGGRGPGGPPREGGRKFFRRKKVCKFCTEKMPTLIKRIIACSGNLSRRAGRSFPGG